jgi:hypothetical protein
MEICKTPVELASHTFPQQQPKSLQAARTAPCVKPRYRAALRWAFGQGIDTRLRRFRQMQEHPVFLRKTWDVFQALKRRATAKNLENNWLFV